MNIGIILPHISPSQIKDEVFDIINDQYKKTKNSYSIFFENVSPNHRTVIAPLMNISDSRFFSGRMISFDYFGAAYSLQLCNKVEPILYFYDLEWMRSNRSFKENIKIYRNEDLKLFTRSKDYAHLIKSYTNREVEVRNIESLLCPQEKELV